MTTARRNLAGITTRELLAKIKIGEPFFVKTMYAHITRVLINGLKKKYGVEVTTSQAIGGIWIVPVKSE